MSGIEAARNARLFSESKTSIEVLEYFSHMICEKDQHDQQKVINLKLLALNSFRSDDKVREAQKFQLHLRKQSNLN